MLEDLRKVSVTPIGSGSLNLFAFGNPDRVGGKLDYKHRISEGWSAVASAEIAREFGGQTFREGLNASARLGLRFRW